MFNEYIGIDWSGAKSPHKSHAVAVASIKNRHNACLEAQNTKLSRSDVFTLLSEKVALNQRTLVGIDCNLGYAQGVAQQQFGKHINYATLWQTVDDINQEHDDFFAGNFWNSPHYGKAFWTQGKMPAWFDADALRRDTEKRAIASGVGIPESPFKLIGAKQVGKGGLAGMRVMHQLKQQFGDAIAIWPFEHKQVTKAKLVISELYPRLFIRLAGFGNAKVRNVSELNRVLSHFECAHINTLAPHLIKRDDKHQDTINDHLTDAIIATAGMQWLCKHASPLDVQTSDAARTIEGWIFGVGAL